MPVTHDKDLRARVKLFGNLLGEVLRTQESGQVLDVVETLRKGFIELRATEDPARRAQLMALIEALDPQTLTHVLRAFSSYFLLTNIAVLAVIYVVTSYAVFALVRWAARRSVAQIAALASLVARALPLLLLFTAFIFLSTEVWQVAGALTGVPYAATLGIFFLLGALFVLIRVPGTLRGLGTFADWTEVGVAIAGTPAAGLDVPTDGPAVAAPLSVRQRLNVGLVTVFSQALQVSLVSLVLALFFVVFGFLAIPVETTASWTGLREVHTFVTWHLDGRDLVITEPLLRVAGFLGAFTGMYFTVVLSTDATYRDEFAEDVGPQIRQALAVRIAYLHHRLRPGAG